MTNPNKIHKIVSTTMDIIIEEFTLPFINSYVPIQESPNKVTPIGKQIICLALEAGKFLETNIIIAIPNINMATLRAKTKLAVFDSNPMSVKNEFDMKNNKQNK